MGIDPSKIQAALMNVLKCVGNVKTFETWVSHDLNSDWHKLQRSLKCKEFSLNNLVKVIFVYSGFCYCFRYYLIQIESKSVHREHSNLHMYIKAERLNMRCGYVLW